MGSALLDALPTVPWMAGLRRRSSTWSMTVGLLVDEVAPALAAGHEARLGDAAPEDMEDRARFLAAGIVDTVVQQALRPAGPGDAARVAAAVLDR